MPGSGNLGGARTKGQRSAKCQKIRDTAINVIYSRWGVNDVVGIFPPDIRPSTELGDSAISHLCNIAGQKSKDEALQYFRDECRQENGTYKKIRWSDLDRVVKKLKMERTQSAASVTPVALNSLQNNVPSLTQPAPAVAPSADNTTRRPTNMKVNASKPPPVPKKTSAQPSKSSQKSPPLPSGLFAPNKQFKGYHNAAAALGPRVTAQRAPTSHMNSNVSDKATHKRPLHVTSSKQQNLSNLVFRPPSRKPKISKKTRKSVTFNEQPQIYEFSVVETMPDEETHVLKDASKNSQNPTLGNEIPPSSPTNTRTALESDSGEDTDVIPEREYTAYLLKKKNEAISSTVKVESPKRKSEYANLTTSHILKKIKSDNKDNMLPPGRLSTMHSITSLASLMFVEPADDQNKEFDMNATPDSPRPLSDFTDDDADDEMQAKGETPDKNDHQYLVAVASKISHPHTHYAEDEAMTPNSPPALTVEPLSTLGDEDEAMTPNSPPNEAINPSASNTFAPIMDMDCLHPAILAADRMPKHLLSETNHGHGGALNSNCPLTKIEATMEDEVMTPTSPIEGSPTEVITPETLATSLARNDREREQLIRDSELKVDTRIYKPIREHDDLVNASRHFRVYTHQEVVDAAEGRVPRRLPLEQRKAMKKWQEQNGEDTYDIVYQGMNAIKIQYDLMWEKIKDKAEITPRADILRGLIKDFEIQIEGYQRKTKLVKPNAGVDGA